MPPTTLLLQSQLNQVAKIIEDSGFSLDEFEWRDVEIPPTVRQAAMLQDRGRVVAAIVHKRTEFFFRFDDEKGTCVFSPSYTERETRRRPEGTWVGWDTQLNNVVEWANSLKREVGEPDLWSLPSGAGLLAAAASAENRPITAEERQKLFQGLDQLKQEMFRLEKLDAREPDLQAERFDIIEEGIAELKDAATRFGRKEWMIFYAGWAQMLIYDLAMKPEVRTLFGKAVTTVLHWLAPGSAPPALGP